MSNEGDTVLIISPFDIFGDVALLGLLGYTIFLIVLGLLHKTSLAKGVSPQKDVGNPYEEWYREQTFSSTLAGFSIAALTFVLAFSQLSEVQRMVEFFLIGFVLETLSFILYKYMVRYAYDYFGTVFQFSGLLAIMNGFFVFVIFKLSITPTIIITVSVAYVIFFIFSVKQLKSYF